MTYNEFLFTQLLSCYNEDFSKLPYDVMYEKGKELYQDFENSEYNNETVSEYDCIESYLKENDFESKEFDQ